MVAFLLQWLNQAYTAEFGSEGDEAAHYVTGMMVRDYVAGGMKEDPVRYAERYYVHYPKVAFGVWPPLFHLTSSVWMLLFSGDRASIMMLIALMAAATAYLVYRFLAWEFGAGAGVIGGLIFLTLPAVQKLSAQVMADMMVALLSLAATLYYARYLEKERWRDSAMFGVMAAAAILTKYNALALALVPLLAVWMAGKLYLLRRWSFWIPGVIVVAIAGPWYVTMNHLVWYAAQPVPGIADIPKSLWTYAKGLVVVLQGILLLTAVAGLFEWRRYPVRDLRWAAPAAQIIAILLFHNFLYIGYDQRYLAQAVPALMMFALKGAVYAVRLVEARVMGEVVAGAMFALLPLINLGPVVGWEPRKQYHGYTEIADRILKESAGTRRVMVSAETAGEGMLVSEIVMRERKPEHVILRASKTFASSTWMQEDYKLLFTPETAWRHLQANGVQYLVVDRGPGLPIPHHAMVKEMVARYSSGWNKVMTVGDVDLYRLPATEVPPGQKMQVDLTRTLGRTLSN